eukprot:8577439-Lingulodinium_polyedra.AAC.1
MAQRQAALAAASTKARPNELCGAQEPPGCCHECLEPGERRRACRQRARGMASGPADATAVDG